MPPYLRFGSVCITPVGFMDATFVWRDKNAASGIGSNFGSVPYNNAGQRKTLRSPLQPPELPLGFRVDGDWKGAHFIGYNEFDFLGTSGATNITVTNGAFVPRIRLYWVDVRKGGWEFLAGQSWSMLTPNRVGYLPAAGRPLLLASHRRELHGGLNLDPPAGHARPLPCRRQSDLGLLGSRTPTSILAVPRAVPQSPCRPPTPPCPVPSLISANLVNAAPQLYSRLHRQDRVRSELAVSRRSRRSREHLQNHQYDQLVARSNTIPRRAAASCSE